MIKGNYDVRVEWLHVQDIVCIYSYFIKFINVWVAKLYGTF